MRKIHFISILILACSCVSVLAQTPSNYKIVNKFHIEGNGKWDYLSIDETTGWLFVSHETFVNVLDVKTGQTLATIPDTKGVHGIALATDFGKGYISCAKNDSSVTVFDLKTLKTLGKIKNDGKKPDAIMYDPFSHKVFVFNAGSNSASVVDPKSDQIIATIPLESNPEFSVSDGKGKVYVNLEEKSMIAVINSATLKVENNWSIAPGTEPTGLAIDKENHRLFSVCANKLMVVVDTESGKVITTLPIGGRVDGAAFDPGNKRAYASCGEGQLTVIQEKDKNSFSVLENVPTMVGAKTVTLDKSTHHIYLPTAEFNAAPEATTENPKPKATLKPGTFMVLDVTPQ